MADIGVTSDVRYGYRDRSNELTHSLVHFPPIQDDADNSGILDPAVGSIAVVGSALALLTKCRQAKDSLSLQVGAGLAGLPTAADAQREWAIRWSYQDNVTLKFYRFDTPAPIDAVVQDDTDKILMSNALVIAFKTAFEANCVSPVGNPVTLISGVIAGRRN
jgi:hypothetical protein